MSSTIKDDRRYTGLLLGSGSHPTINMLRVCGLEAYRQRGQRYTLTSVVGGHGHTKELGLFQTTKRTATEAASNALLYACWRGDRELVIRIVENLRAIIDINTLVDDKGILFWTLQSCGWYIDTKINICRFLLEQYGLKLNANREGDYVLLICARRQCADVVERLITTYGSDIVCVQDHMSVFSCLVKSKNKYEETAIAYLRLRRNEIMTDPCGILANAACFASLSMFRLTMDLFRPVITFKQISNILLVVCSTNGALHRKDKIRAAHSMWANQFTPDLIKGCLVDNWQYNPYCMGFDGERFGHPTHTIIELCMNLICDKGIEIAIAQCITHPNMELVEILIDRNLEQIRTKPELMRHGLIECAGNRDIDIFERILAKVGPSVCALALEFWCQASDLEAARMILEVGAEYGPLIDRLPMILQTACDQGDADMIELLIQYVGDTIKGSDYVSSFYRACQYSREDVIKVLIKHCGHHLNFSSNTDYDTDMRTVTPEIISLLNETFGTSVDATACTRPARWSNTVCMHEYSVGYGGWFTKNYSIW